MTLTSANTSTEFEAFVQAHKDEISDIQAMLSNPLEREPVMLVEQLTQAEAVHARLTTIMAFADAHLDAAEMDNLPREGTAIERQTEQKAKCISQRRFRDVVAGLCRSINTRISLGQSLLRVYEKEFGPRA